MRVSIHLPSPMSRPFHAANQDALHVVARQARAAQEQARQVIEAIERFEQMMKSCGEP